MQFKVPQNIDMEDKILGPLTLIQFLYVVIGTLIVYVLFQTVGAVSIPLFLATGGPVALFTFCMSFLKINDIAFPKFVQAFLLYLTAPKKRMWAKSIHTTDVTTLKAPPKQVEKKIQKTKIEKSEIEKMASVLDTAGWAALRDQHLKEFVSDFQETHHTNPNPPKQTTNKVPVQAQTK